ncbi:hypothetical protein OKA05_03660 [Luteolibacter arcticus]|uniref:Uncharacterized protein n=1 Tax=Luteolibacter arcticus TaxID=1581411 RepID=A0ABT3GDK4_9BACT|nr:hypothetical protein [Luteolibacter arcticus]MCW1921634.1 hypothetical protein [Luteolibacter arcticus]
MKSLGILLASFLASITWSQAQTNGGYTNFIRQKQLPSGVEWDMTVAALGETQSALAINPGGARFELWSVNTVTAAAHMLDSRYVGSYVPIGGVVIRSEDPYDTVPRTRADRPFFVDVTVSGLLSGVADPDASKKVNFLRHVQSYGAAGTGMGIDRSLATMLSQNYIEANGSNTLTFAINSVPGANRAKVRGEERFSVFSLPDNRVDSESGLTYSAPAAQLGAQLIQIWPVADGGLAGITNNQLIRFKVPALTITLNDLYPDSHTYAQVYKGAPQLGTTGKIVPGSSIVINDTVPQSRILAVSDYDDVFEADGQWTMEIVTKTPFGLDRLAHVTFTLDRIIQMNGSVTTID